jgi:hypothetical protein
MGRKLEAKITTVSATELAEALGTAYEELLGRQPKRESVALLLAQSALETGHWKSCHAYNLGNAKAGPSWDGDYCFYAADEIVSAEQAARAFADRMPRTDGVQGHNVELTPLRSGQVQVTLHPDHAWCRFRAFESLGAGALDYLALLHRRFALAWPAVEAGDPTAFVRTLKELHYFTASVERYLPPVAKLFETFSKLLREERPSPPVVPRPVVLGSGDDRPVLGPKSRGPAVLELQRILIGLGYTGLSETGVVDEETTQAIELFQLQHIDQAGKPLLSDGIVGPKTWWALQNPSGEAQRNFFVPPSVDGLTEGRKKLLATLAQEHRKPVFEVPDGSNRSKDIDRYFGKTGIVGQPWCCAFVSWALEQALGRFPVGGVHHLGVQRMWVTAKDLGMAVTTPKPGDVFVQIKSKGTGHTGFVIGVSEDGKSVFTCEGNAGNRLKYGQRQMSTIHHFFDCIQDGQSEDFTRGTNVRLDDLGSDGTR